GFETGPVRDGASAWPLWLPSGRATASSRVGAVLWPAGGRVLPRLLASVGGQVEQPIAVVHCLYAARRRPISLEDIGPLSQVANDVHPAHSPSNQQGLERVLRRVPRRFPAHEVAIPGALVVRTLTEHGEGDVARMKVGQLADLRCNPGAP